MTVEDGVDLPAHAGVASTDLSGTLRGRCLCGAVAFEVQGPPKWVLWCHCESCRRHTGAAASTYASFDTRHVDFVTGAMTAFRSSPGTTRGFCGACGSTLSCSNARLPNEIHLHVGAFDDAHALVPTGALYAGERLDWANRPLRTGDGLRGLVRLLLRMDRKARRE